MTHFTRTLRVLTLAGLVCALPAVSATAQSSAYDAPEQLQGVGIVEKLNDTLPLDLEFTDSNGKRVKLADYFNNDKPKILTLNYYRCPQLCGLTLNGLLSGLRDVKDLSLGKDFEVITVSVNPKEGPELADVNKRGYLSRYGREGGENGWFFHTGEQANITKLADAVGFRYRLDPKTGEYAHTSSIMFITPQGRISLYMNEVNFQPKDLRYALIEASQNRIGSFMDNVVLFMCYQYDSESGSYVPAAWKIMRGGGLLTMLVIIVGLTLLWRRDLKSRRHITDAAADKVALGGMST